MDKNNNDKENKQSFLSKLKNDKKYKAKVELTGYVVFIVILIIFLNVSNIGNNYNYNSVNYTNETKDNNAQEEQQNKNLFKEINDNYSYNIDVLIKIKQEDDSIIENKINYNGKSYKDNMIINKVYNNTTSTYYKVEDEYYFKENEDYKLAVDNEIYELLDEKYIEFNGVKKYIEKATLDHFTDYSSGKKEYTYNLKVKDIIQSYKGDDIVEINVVDENNIISMSIDYTNLLKLINENINECEINYKYDNINTVEKFNIIEESDNNVEEKVE